MKRALLLLAALLALSISVDAQRRLRWCCQTPGGGGGGGDDVYLREDCGSGGSAWPTCGATSVFNAAEEGTTWDWERRDASGPQGQTCTEWNDPPSGVGEEYMGRSWTSPGLPSITQGNSVFVRWYWKPVTPFTDLGDFAIKQFILGDADPNPDDSRIIATFQAWSDSRSPQCPGANTNCYAWDVDRNINGWYASCQGCGSNDTWIAMQVEIDTSSTTIANDGAFRLWVNNDVQGSPDDDSLNRALPATYSGQFGFGMFGPTDDWGPDVKFLTCMVEVGPTFDNTWTSGGRFWSRTLRPGDAWRLALRRMLPWRGFSRADRVLALRTR